MKIQTTIEVSKAELLDYISDAVNRVHKWGTRYDLATGVALDISPTTSGDWRISWGERPEETEPATATETSVPAAL